MFDETPEEGIDYDDEPLPAKWKYVDRLARQMIGPETIGHPPRGVPDLSRSEMKKLTAVFEQLQAGDEQDDLAEWVRERMKNEVMAAGQLDPIGGRIYGLIAILGELAKAGIEPFDKLDVPEEKPAHFPRKDYAGPPMICEATGVDPVECTVANEDPGRPFLLSHAAADRLEFMCLTPIEWYRLVVLHGFDKYHLHEDFYADDGSPLQGHFPVVKTPENAVPTLDEVRRSLPDLIEFVLFKLQIDHGKGMPDLMAAVAPFGRPAVEAELLTRDRRPVLGRIDELCWDVRIGLGYVDEARLRRRWVKTAADLKVLKQNVPQLAADSIPIIGSAATIELILQAAELLEKKTAGSADPMSVSAFGIVFALRDKMGADMLLELAFELMKRGPKPEPKHGPGLITFYDFHDERVLNWIEQNVYEPISYEWGTAAACNCFSWDRAVKWLGMGRPLSLVALDAMKNCRGFDKEDGHMSGVFKDYAPKVTGRPKAAEIDRVLTEYAVKDHDDRVVGAIAVILAFADKIFR